MGYSAVLFDWGGTLVHDDTLAPGAAATAVVARLRDAGTAVTLEAFEEAFEEAFVRALPPYEPGVSQEAPRIDRILESALVSLGVEPAADLLEQCCLAFAHADMAAQEVFDDARALLHSLRYRGFRVALVSNTIFPAHLFALRLQAAALPRYFDAVICSADVGFLKPHPAIYRAALDALGVSADDALFVGDRHETDIAGATATGIAAVRIDRRRDTSDLNEGVIAHLSAVNELLGEGIRPREGGYHASDTIDDEP